MDEALNLQIVVDRRHVVECAAALQQQLRPHQWTTLCQLAAELVARHETVAAGERMLVVPARPGDLEQAQRALRLVAAGRE